MMHSRALALFLLTSLTLPVSAQQPLAEPRAGAVLTVKGEGRVEVKPDYVRFFATVSTKGRSLAETAAAHEERATRAFSVLQGLKGAGAGIITTSFTINQDRPPLPQGRPPTPEKPPEPPFTAVTNFDLRVKPVDGLNGVVTKLASSGLFEVQRVSFQVEEERSALNRARRAAMLDARDQAEAYADAGGVRLVEVIEISDGAAIPLNATEAADLARSPYVQIVPPAVVAFTASVKVVWRIAPR